MQFLIQISAYRLAMVVSGLTKILQKVNELVSVEPPFPNPLPPLARSVLQHYRLAMVVSGLTKILQKVNELVSLGDNISL